MAKTIFLFILILPCWCFAQSFSGEWEGWLSQDGKPDSFLYQVKLELVGSDYAGSSYSSANDGAHAARFQISGTADGQQLILQEIEQLSPKNPKWCLKYMLLKWSLSEGIPVLRGHWKADGCTPGVIELRPKLKPVMEETALQLPFSIAGKWTGHLQQTDRDYGFYFEFELEDDHSGRSYIVSEDNGGTATHHLNWQYDDLSERLFLEETAIAEKSQEGWKWCIKRADLKMTEKTHQYTLEGPWEGYLEDTDGSEMNCAPGLLYLEKPILTERKTVIKEAYDPYEKQEKRPVEVERIIEVRKPNLKIKVWDNGTVDGDIITIFLNGERILNKFMVSKRKRGFPITINTEGDNFLILHADDLGEITPNTVAVSIDDGVEEQVIILSSNLAESGAVLIKQFKIK